MCASAAHWEQLDELLLHARTASRKDQMQYTSSSYVSSKSARWSASKKLPAATLECPWCIEVNSIIVNSKELVVLVRIDDSKSLADLERTQQHMLTRDDNKHGCGACR